MGKTRIRQICTVNLLGTELMSQIAPQTGGRPFGFPVQPPSIWVHSNKTDPDKDADQADPEGLYR